MVEPFSNRPDRRPRAPLSSRGADRDADPLDQRLDRWMSAGRQFVDGVSGARPGGRNREGRPAGRPGFEGLGRWVEDRLDWLLEEDDDWREPWQQERPSLQGSDRRGSARPWAGSEPSARSSRSSDQAPSDRFERVQVERVQAEPPERRPLQSPASSSPRRPLEARSRRQPLQAAVPSEALGSSPQVADPQDWPEAELFQVPRWQRQTPAQPALEPGAPRQLSAAATPSQSADQTSPGRPLPRSTRRRGQCLAIRSSRALLWRCRAPRRTPRRLRPWSVT